MLNFAKNLLLLSILAATPAAAGPIVAGKMGLSLTCQAEKLGDPSLVYDIELTAK